MMMRKHEIIDINIGVVGSVYEKIKIQFYRVRGRFMEPRSSSGVALS